MKLLVIVCVLLVAPLSSCSKNLSSLCDDSVKNNLLQETYEKNRNPLKMAIANTGFCYNSTNVIGDYCDVKIEVKDIREIDKNSFSVKCMANLKYSVVFNEQKYKNFKDNKINLIIYSFNNEVSNVNEYVSNKFREYNVQYNKSDLLVGIEKRKSTLNSNKDEKIKLLNMELPDFVSQKSAFEVNEIVYTVSESENFMNITLNDISPLTQGE